MLRRFHTLFTLEIPLSWKSSSVVNGSYKYMYIYIYECQIVPFKYADKTKHSTEVV